MQLNLRHSDIPPLNDLVHRQSAALMSEVTVPVSTQLSLFSYLTLILRSKRVSSLWCLVDGDSRPFKVTALDDADVTDLKKLIKEEGKKGILCDVDAKDLDLWKVRDR